MNVIATVNISKGNFEGWLTFFQSYEEERRNFVEDEIVRKTSESTAEVLFKITDIDGLTALSNSELVRAGEEVLGVAVELTPQS
jgi:hypothetical protein